MKKFNNKVLLMQNNTTDNMIDKISLSDISYIKIGDYQILYEELFLHGVDDEDIVNNVEIDVTETENVQVMRMLKNNGKYYFYPLCDLYFE